MFCKKCGRKLENGANFCEGCGTRVINVAPVVSEASNIAPVNNVPVETPVVEEVKPVVEAVKTPVVEEVKPVVEKAETVANNAEPAINVTNSAPVQVAETFTGETQTLTQEKVKGGKGKLIAIIAAAVAVVAVGIVGIIMFTGKDDSKKQDVVADADSNGDITPMITEIATPTPTVEPTATPTPTPEPTKIVPQNLLANEAGLELLESVKGHWNTLNKLTDHDLKLEMRMPSYLVIDDEFIQNDGLVSKFHRKNKYAMYVVEDGKEYIVFRGYLDATYKSDYYKVDMRISLLPNNRLQYDIRKDGGEWQYFGTLRNDTEFYQDGQAGDILDLVDGYEEFIEYAEAEYGSWDDFLTAIDTDFGGDKKAAFKHISYDNVMAGLLEELGVNSLDEAVKKGTITVEEKAVYDIMEEMYDCYANHLDAITKYAKDETLEYADLKSLLDEITQIEIKY